MNREERESFQLYSPTMRTEEWLEILEYFQNYKPSTEAELPREERQAILKKLLRVHFGKKKENR